MDFPIRAISADDLHAFGAANAHSFGYQHDPEMLDRFRDLFEFDRTLAAFDGDQIVSTTSVYGLDMAIPGGRTPVAGVTWVAVRPTHRRKGILAAMMRQQLDDIRDRGEALAALWASETPIYGRFGYGMAAEGVEWHVDRVRTALRLAPSTPGRTRLVTRDEALEAWPAVHDRVMADRPGFFHRWPEWWRMRTLREPERPMAGFSPSFLVQYEEGGQVDGYVRYRIQESAHEGSVTSTLRVSELTAATDAAYGALWSYIFGVDLIGRIEAAWRPVDEPLLWMLADSRRLVRRTQDTLWARIVDVPAALGARRFSTEGRLVIEVHDAFCPWIEGRYELEGGPDGAACRATTATPDVALDVDTLGALYLGHVQTHSLKQAGRLEGDTDALRWMQGMFAWDPPPWCPEIF